MGLLVIRWIHARQQIRTRTLRQKLKGLVWCLSSSCILHDHMKQLWIMKPSFNITHTNRTSCWSGGDCLKKEMSIFLYRTPLPDKWLYSLVICNGQKRTKNFLEVVQKKYSVIVIFVLHYYPEIGFINTSNTIVIKSPRWTKTHSGYIFEFLPKKQ